MATEASAVAGYLLCIRTSANTSASMTCTMMLKRLDNFNMPILLSTHGLASHEYQSPVNLEPPQTISIYVYGPRFVNSPKPNDAQP